MVALHNDLRGQDTCVLNTGTQTPSDVTVRIFGSLRPDCEALDLPYEFRLVIPQTGVTGLALAAALGFSAEKIEGIFINQVVRPITAMVSPGDRVAFVPYDTPGPHRFFLGLYAAGRSGHARTDTDEGTRSDSG